MKGLTRKAGVPFVVKGRAYVCECSPLDCRGCCFLISRSCVMDKKFGDEGIRLFGECSMVGRTDGMRVVFKDKGQADDVEA